MIQPSLGVHPTRRLYAPWCSEGRPTGQGVGICARTEKKKRVLGWGPLQTKQNSPRSKPYIPDMLPCGTPGVCSRGTTGALRYTRTCHTMHLATIYSRGLGVSMSGRIKQPRFEIPFCSPRIIRQPSRQVVIHIPYTYHRCAIV